MLEATISAVVTPTSTCKGDVAYPTRILPVDNVLKRPYDELITLASRVLVVKRVEIAVEKVERGIIKDERPYETIEEREEIPGFTLRDDRP
jgi:hypothetical protein